MITVIIIIIKISCSRVLPEKLTGPQLVKKLPSFYGTRMFITPFTRAHQLSRSWTRSIHSIPPSLFLKTHFNIMLPSTPGSSKRPLSVRFPNLNPVCTSPFPIRATSPHTRTPAPIITQIIKNNEPMTIDSAKRSIWESDRCLAGQGIFAFGYLAINMPSLKPILFILLQLNPFIQSHTLLTILAQAPHVRSAIPALLSSLYLYYQNTRRTRRRHQITESFHFPILQPAISSSQLRPIVLLSTLSLTQLLRWEWKWPRSDS